MPRCTVTDKKTSLLKYLDLEIIVLAIALLIATAGFFVSSTAHASDGMVSSNQQTNTEQLASIDTDKVQHQHKRGSSKRSATTDHSADADSQLGGFSREDGAMMGAYGDGEYAD